MSGAADVWSYLLAGGESAEQAVVHTSAQIREVELVHGLVVASPLQVSSTARVAGDVSQTVTDVADTATVARV